MYATFTSGILYGICVALFGHILKFIVLLVLELKETPYNSLSIDWLLTAFREYNIEFGSARVSDQIDCMRKNLKDGSFEACKFKFWAYQTGKWGFTAQTGELPQGKESWSAYWD